MATDWKRTRENMENTGSDTCPGDNEQDRLMAGASAILAFTAFFCTGLLESKATLGDPNRCTCGLRSIDFKMLRREKRERWEAK